MAASVIPFIAQGVKAPQIENPWDASLKNAQTSLTNQEALTSHLNNQEAAAKLTDQQAIRKAMLATTDGDPATLQTSALQFGARPSTVLALSKSLADQRKALAEADKDDLAAGKERHDALAGLLQSYEQQPDDQKQQGWPSLLSTVMQRKLMTPKEFDQFAQTHPQYPGAEANGLYINGLKTESTLFSEAQKAKEAANQTKTADAAALNASTNVAKEGREAVLQTEQLPGIQAEAQRKQMVTAAMKEALADPAKGAAAIDAALPANVDPQANAGYKAAWQSAMAAGSPESAAKIVEAAATHAASMSPAKQQLDINKAVAQAKAEMPTKIATAGAEARARAEAFPAPAGEGLDIAAEQYLNTGQITGSRNPALAVKIMNRAGELASQRGLDAQATLIQRSAATAARGALNSVTKQYETLKPFADMAEKNADILEQKSRDVTDLGASFFNTPVRELESKFGSTKVAAFKAAMLPVQADFARILSSPTGSGVLTDESKREMSAALGPGATPGQIKASVDVFRTDAKNRRAAYEAQLKDLQGSTVVGGSGGTPTAQPKATHRYNPSTGKIEPIQ